MHKRERYKMTPVEIRDALARGMNFDAVMARHASDIQREQGIDMGLSMARARTDVQNIQNQRDEGIDPPQIASPAAPTIGAQSRALDPLMTALTYNPPTAAKTKTRSVNGTVTTRTKYSSCISNTSRYAK